MVRKCEVDGRLLVRLPREVKSWIEREAAHNGSSQNSEVIRAIRVRMESQRPVSRFERLSLEAAG
jgi:predicted HicB family RNase H-like nuclease